MEAHTWREIACGAEASRDVEVAHTCNEHGLKTPSDGYNSAAELANAIAWPP